MKVFEFAYNKIADTMPALLAELESLRSETAGK